MHAHAWSLTSLLALLPALVPSQQPAEAWEALPIPSLAVAPPATAATPRLLGGRHLLLPGEELQLEPPTAGAHLPLPALLDLLQEDSALRRQALRLQPSAPPLMARGERSSLDAARALLGDLERQGRDLEIEVRAWLTAGAAGVGTHPSPEVVEAAVAGQPELGRATLRSGATAVLGERRARSFLAGYTVEIASGSGVAGPALGRVLTGRTLHVRASRVRDGRGVVLEGFLDLAELEELVDFDPGTADLGRIQQPRVGAVQVAFAGVLAPGATLCVAIAGAPLAEPDWTLWLQARATPSTAGAAPSWRAREAAFLGLPVVDLPLPRPGAVFEELEADDATPQVFVQPLSAAEVAQAADSARAAAGRPGRTPIVWGGGLVIAPQGEDELWAEVDGLIAAAERDRLVESTLEVVSGDLSVRLPVLEGRPARVLAVDERAVLAGYDLQVAQDTWMPHPVVQCALDGLMVQGRSRGTRFEGTAWRASSAAPVELPREQTGLARLQLEERGLASVPLRVPVGPPLRAIPAGTDAPEVLLTLTPRR